MLYSASLILFTVTLGIGIISPILPILVENMGVGGILLGLIFSSFSISRLLFLPLFGTLSDRYNKKIIILLGLSLYSIIALLYIAAKDPFLLILVRFLHGMSSAMAVPVIFALVASASPPGEEGKFMGILNRSIFIGMAFGPFIGGFLTDITDENVAFAFMSIMSLISLLIAAVTIPDVRLKKKSCKRGAINRRVLAAIIYRILNSIGRGSIMTFLPIYCYFIGFDYTRIGLLIFLNLIVSGIIQPYAGIFSDRRGVILPVVLSNFASALALHMIPYNKEFTSLIALNILLGISSAFSLPAVSSIIAVEGKGSGNIGGLMGYFSASKSLGRALGPIVAGILYDFGGGGVRGIHFAFSGAAFFSLMAALIFSVVIREPEREIEIE